MNVLREAFPILCVDDVEQAAAFYASTFGFGETYRHQEDGVPDIFETDGKHYVTLWFEAEYESGEAAPLARHELDAVAWFHEHALPEPLFPPLSKLRSGRTLA